MAATIRLQRVGRNKQASFRIVVAEKSKARGGPAIETLGIYNPRTEPSTIRFDAARALHWLRAGALPSDSVASIFRATGVLEQFRAGLTPEALAEPVVRVGAGLRGGKTSQRGVHGGALAEAAAAEVRAAPAVEEAVAEEAVAEEAVAEAAAAEAAADVELAGEVEAEGEVPSEAEEEGSEEEEEKPDA